MYAHNKTLFHEEVPKLDWSTSRNDYSLQETEVTAAHDNLRLGTKFSGKEDTMDTEKIMQEGSHRSLWI